MRESDMKAELGRLRDRNKTQAKSIQRLCKQIKRLERKNNMLTERLGGIKVDLKRVCRSAGSKGKP